MSNWKRLLRLTVFAFLALLSFTGIMASAVRVFVSDPAMGVTEALKMTSRRYSGEITTASGLLEESPAEFPASSKTDPLKPLQDALELGAFTVPIAVVALHVINIFLILSAPAGGVLLGVLFLLLIAALFIDDDRRLRNISMAVGTAAWVFIFAIPGSILATGQLSRLYTGPLRYSAVIRLETFRGEYSSLWDEWAEEEGKAIDATRLVGDMTRMVKGLPEYVSFSAGSWLLDCIALPLFIAWFFYRLGIFLANTFFGTLRVQRFGKTLKRVFLKE